MSLQELGVEIVDQNDLESSLTRQANEVLLSKDRELESKRLDKVKSDISKVDRKLAILTKRLNDPRTKISQQRQIRDEITWVTDNELVPLQQDQADIEGRIRDNERRTSTVETSGDGRMADESERDYLIRIGRITAFGNENVFGTGAVSHVELKQPGFGREEVKEEGESDVEELKDEGEEEELKDEEREEELKSEEDTASEDYAPEDSDVEVLDMEELATEDLNEDDLDTKSLDADNEDDNDDNDGDDGDPVAYARRLQLWCKQRAQLRKTPPDLDAEPFLPHPSIPDTSLSSFRLPGDIHPSLFDYQKTCVQWLWELYNQKTGGIIGDEMGLGKTIQVISFLAGLHYSKLIEKPVLIVVPATVLNQWVKEFHKWWPPLRVVILHSIGTGMGKKVDEAKLEEYLQNDKGDTKRSFKGMSNQINASAIVDSVFESGHVLVTTYVGLRIYARQLLTRQWGYCVLDEGHKIRNPNSEISLLCKRIKTYNRVILSGTPIQNNLVELWSLFDFIFPGRLGTLPIFEQQFAIPINMGGYANASNLQVQTSYKCATILRDLISPYLLRRLKHDVAKDLPKKEEMVLFVKLTQYQQDMYQNFLQSEDLNAILNGKRNMLMGVDVLRKICNHPDLVLKNTHSADYGNSSRSGKLEVTKKLVDLWSKDHKILVFCQTRQMLDILEKTMVNMGVEYLRMDGTTPIVRRQGLVDRFNGDKSVKVFLLTTKVGGLGVNLTGADRIIIYDPDWNPSTDIQARERAWRLGQKRDIVIYRLMIQGSIEEKIYQRQIFKTFLTNKILKDPKQRRFFRANEMQDLFSLDLDEEKGRKVEKDDVTATAERMAAGLGAGTGPGPGRSGIESEGPEGSEPEGLVAIPGVHRINTFDDPSASHEDQLMQGIFSGVTKVNHEEIVQNEQNAGVQKEVNRIVDQSLKLLNESRKLTRKNRIGTPTWTGRFGKAGKQVGSFGARKRKDNMSSSAVLSGLKSKKTETVEPNLLGSIVKMLESGPKTSNQILVQLRTAIDVKNSKDVLMVKTILNKVSDWDGKQKKWVLKPGSSPEPRAS